MFEGSQMLGTISIRTVETLAQGETLWDAGHRGAVRGFGVRRQQDGASYVVKYRVGGRQRFLTIGPHGSPWTPDQARREARRLLGLVASGGDPADERAQYRLQAADILRKIIDRYLRHARTKQKPRSYIETERHLLVNWRPLHPLSVFKIRRHHVAARLADIAEGQGPVAATQARAALSAMFNWAIREGYDVANPVQGTNRPATSKGRERVLSDAELVAIWRACDDRDYGRIVRLLMLTGQRRDEIGGLRWDEVATGVDGATLLPISFIRLPPERTKNHREHIIPLSALALGLLPDRRQGRDFIFGDGPRRGYSGWSKSKTQLDARIGFADWVLHDLRRTVATGLADRLGVLPHIVEAVLNHVSGHRAGVAGIYNRARYAAEMRDALSRWADHIAGLTEQRSDR
jgi:integrase